MTTWETAWWNRWPGRLEYELDKLEAAGYQVVSQDQSTGLLVLEVLASDDQTGVGEILLTVRFPDTYPSTAPQVIAPDLGLKHHQHPFGGTLCLIGRSTLYWDSHFHLAELLDQQLRKAITAGAAEAGDGQDELDQAEPFVAYYSYAPGMEFLSDDDGTAMPPEGAGEAEFLLAGSVPPPAEAGARTIGLIDSLRSSGVSVHEAGAGLRRMFGTGATRVPGRWVVLGAPVRVDDPEEIWRAAADSDPAGVAVATVGGASLQVRAVGFPDERSRSEYGTSWVVVIRRLGQSQRRPARRGSGNPAKRAQATRTPDAYHLVRVDRAGVTDLTARSPLTAATADRSVLVIGCGAIGSVLIDQLARAGVGRFTLVDRDVLEPGNLTRHAGTLHGTGLHKAVAMAQHVGVVNPHAEVTFMDLPVGVPVRDRSGRLGGGVLAEAMGEVDLVIDASAEVGVQELSAEMARSLGVPWMMLSASEGAAGGTVVVVDADADWCFACFQWRRAEGAIPFPVAITGDSLQPVGCAEPTFAGAGFDLAEVSLHAARAAVARLLRGQPDAYPEDDHDVWILNLRSPGGSRVPPTWTAHAVARHPSCQAHQARP